MIRKNKNCWLLYYKTCCGGLDGLLTVLNNFKMFLISAYFGLFPLQIKLTIHLNKSLWRKEGTSPYIDANNFQQLLSETGFIIIKQTRKLCIPKHKKITRYVYGWGDGVEMEKRNGKWLLMCQGFLYEVMKMSKIISHWSMQFFEYTKSYWM